MSQKLTPYLWFDNQAEEAAAFYTSVFDNSRIVNILRTPGDGAGSEGAALTVEFELDGSRFVALNGGPAFTFTEAVSFVIDCADQAQVDYYWEAFGRDGEPGPCGWVKDRYGLSWQVVPAALVELLTDADTGRSSRAMQAMQGMSKIVIADLYAAADNLAPTA